MPRLAHALPFALGVSAAGMVAPSAWAQSPGSAAAQEGAPTPTTIERDEAAQEGAEGKKPESLSAIRGSTLLLDQSMTTQTAHVEPSPQLSYVPLYEWWISLRPRYWFTENLYAWFRFDYYKEFTNSDNGRTLYREDSFGDIWANLVYQRELGARKRTKVTGGLRALLPTSKASADAGIYVQIGPTASFSQKVIVRGESASSFNDVHAGVALSYLHTFSQATTPISGNLDYVRQDTEGRSFVSDQLSGATIVHDQIISILDTGVTILPKLAFTADMIFFSQWHYAPTNASVPILGGTVNVPRSADDQQFTETTWFLTTLDYSLFPELNLGLGYMSLANAIAPDGQRRGVFGSDNIWWSPDARVFFDVTANLDKIYDDVAGKKNSVKEAASQSRIRQIANTPPLR